jgi:D-cysteine desulfhydrase
MAGLIGLSRRGHFGRDEDVLFLHTGGVPALHVYESEILGEVPLP